MSLSRSADSSSPAVSSSTTAAIDDGASFDNPAKTAAGSETAKTEIRTAASKTTDTVRLTTLRFDIRVPMKFAARARYATTAKTAP